MKKIRPLGILIAVFAVLFNAVPVMATVQPLSTPTIVSIHANRNLLVTGDVLFYGDYDIPYNSTALPTELAATTYAFSLFENTTEIGGITPYSYGENFDKGYNHGVFGLYFEDEITWGNTYFIRLSQSPAYFTTPLSWDFPITTSAYTVANDTAANQDELTSLIIEAAQRMETYYENTTMVEPGPSRTVLTSPVGENYFKGAIPGLLSMAPNLFYVQAAAGGTDLTPHTWTTAQFDTYAGRFNGTWVGNDTAAIAGEFGVLPSEMMGLMFISPLAIGMVIFSAIRLRKVEAGYICACLVIIMGGLLGWFPAAIESSLLQLAGIYCAYVIFYSRG